MRANQNFRPDSPVRAGYGYAFGVRTMLDPKTADSDAPTNFEFGWDGAAGAYVAIDPYHKLTCVYLHHVNNHGPVYTETHPVIRDTMYYLAGICND
jgi:CubicO group peptidase (beta-lactamase class C family)